MNGKLIIKDSTNNDPITDILVNPLLNSYEVTINVPMEEDFISLISKPYDFDDAIKVSKIIYEDEPECIDFLDDFEKNRVQYLTNIEDIIIKSSPKKIAEYIKNNPILQTKKIIFEVELNNSILFLDEISNAFGDNTSNLYFDVKGNFELITFSEYKATVEAINNIINDAKRFNFSPMEKIMYIYDIVRNKVYVEVDENQDKNISRNLSSALLGDKIVCKGYSVIFKTLLQLLDIKCEEVFLYRTNKNSGHARNVIYVKDEKYGIDGIYYFDPTWGSKARESDNAYLYSYRYFAMTKQYADKIDNKCYIDLNLPYKIEPLIHKFIEILKNDDIYKVPNSMLKQMNYLSRLVNGRPFLTSKKFPSGLLKLFDSTNEQMIERANAILNSLNKPICAETMLQILFNVRKMQFYTMPDKYPFGANEFFETAFMSEWIFKEPEKKILMELIEEPIETWLVKYVKFTLYNEKVDLEKQIEQVKLSRTLRNVYEKESQKSR